MPYYTYVNPKTGETWQEFRKIAEMEDGVDGVNVALVPSAPAFGDPTLMSRQARENSKKFQNRLAEIKKSFPDSKL